MRITVAICTWNRARLLKNALAQMTRLVIPPQLEWELLVVNNNSTDDTDEVIASFSRLIPITRIFEPSPGLSVARNAAVARASGDYIMWTDDDVLVGEQWLNAYTAAFQRHPEAAVFGGPIAPWFEGTPPVWLERAWPSLMNVYATRDLGAEILPLSREGNYLPYGANFAIKMTEQAKRQYDPSLGVRPGQPLLGEETQLIVSILDAGGRGWWVPDASVRHWIPRSRQTLRYVRGYYQALGRTQSFKRTAAPTELQFFGKPLWLWRMAIYAEAIYRLRRPFVGPEVWVKDMVSAASCWAQIRTHALHN